MRKHRAWTLLPILLTQSGLCPSPCTSASMDASVLTQFQQAAAACAPSAESGCLDGKCPTSSCKKSGMGLTAMSCFGINIPQPDMLNSQTSSSADPPSSGTIATLLDNPCAYLACVLDTSNCSSEPSKRSKQFIPLIPSKPTGTALEGGANSSAGYCLGKVMPVEGKTAEELHPTASVLLGHPCIEHRDPGLSLVPPFGASICIGGDCPLPAGSYVVKGWHVCDCKGWMGAGWPPGDNARASL